MAVLGVAVSSIRLNAFARTGVGIDHPAGETPCLVAANIDLVSNYRCDRIGLLLPPEGVVVLSNLVLSVVFTVKEGVIADVSGIDINR